MEISKVAVLHSGSEQKVAANTDDRRRRGIFHSQDGLPSRPVPELMPGDVSGSGMAGPRILAPGLICPEPKDIF